MSTKYTVKDLITELLRFEMHEEVYVEIESGHDRMDYHRSGINSVTHDGFAVRIVPIDYLIDRDAPL